MAAVPNLQSRCRLRLADSAERGQVKGQIVRADVECATCASRFIGTPEYVRTWGVERLEVEDALLRQLPLLPSSSARGSSSASVQRRGQTTR